MQPYYKIATRVLSPFVPIWLWFRMRRGKEDRGHIKERYGYSYYARPKGTLLWIHAASVGETNSVMGLIHTLRERFPKLGILLTTGTVTSAALARDKLPKGVLHHYVPIDTPDATQRFIRHWLPDVVWFVESELWPNLIDAAARYHCFMALINARMSERSFSMWKKYPAFTNDLLSSFQICYAQSSEDAARLRALGAKEVVAAGNLKYDAPLLSCDESELIRFGKMIQGRKFWLAASTHPEEEKLIMGVHAQLKKRYPDLLTLMVPRHPERGADVGGLLSKTGKVARRSLKETITPDTEFYVADTLGELGLFYRLCSVVFMGGSLVRHGGQNPLEAARLSCAMLVGPHTHNFSTMYAELKNANAVLMVKDANDLATKVGALLNDFTKQDHLQSNAQTFVESEGGTSDMIIDAFAPLFEPHENT